MSLIQFIQKYFIKNTVFKNRLHILEGKIDLYDRDLSVDDIYEYQLVEFNKIWSSAILNTPFYKMWKNKHSLPDSIQSLEELKHFPILTKKDIQSNKDLIFNHLNKYSIISTGGSTGEPSKFPTSKIEQYFNYANTYMARARWHIKPLDHCLLFWGHSHLFGAGVLGRVNQYKRIMQDWLINSVRLNAYDMSVETTSYYHNEVCRRNPTFILGYTSILYKISKFIKENNLSIGNKSNLKAVIVTSEVVTDYDIELIESVFNVPCVIEYGMAETGVIAYQLNKSKRLSVFWDSFVCVKNEDNNLLVSTISNKLFPLINYQTDDIVECADSPSILIIDEIQGRKKDILNVAVRDGEISLSGILMVHILKSYKGIYSIQFKQLENLSAEIRLVTDLGVDLDDVKKYFIHNIKIDHKDILAESFIFKNLDHIEKTIAGKEKWMN
jgi:phenylacetate-CoA ligase